MDGLDALLGVLRGRRVVALTGAGCSTESGIPDYRGPDTPPRARPPIQHREFVDRADVRRRYWARSMLGWPRLAAARPNRGHAALAALERAGAVAGVITQNVDGLHHGAGSREVVELHGALARVRCLACGDATTRDELQRAARRGEPGLARTRPRRRSRPTATPTCPTTLVADFDGRRVRGVRRRADARRRVLRRQRAAGDARRRVGDCSTAPRCCSWSARR